jgi:hypothetical protein
MADQGEIVGPGLIHDRSAGRAARVEIQHQRKVLHIGLRAKTLRAQQAHLLAVGDEKLHVGFQPSRCSQRAHRFQECADRSGVVSGARAARDRIVMGHHQDRRPRRARRCARRWQSRQHILEGDEIAVAVLHRRRLDGRAQAQALELFKQICTCLSIGGRPGRMRLHRDRADVRHRIFERKLGVAGRPA